MIARFLFPLNTPVFGQFMQKSSVNGSFFLPSITEKNNGSLNELCSCMDCWYKFQMFGSRKKCESFNLISCTNLSNQNYCYQIKVPNLQFIEVNEKKNIEGCNRVNLPLQRPVFYHQKLLLQSVLRTPNADCWGLTSTVSMETTNSSIYLHFLFHLMIGA